MENKERLLMPWEQLYENKYFRYLYPRLLALIPAFLIGTWLDEYARRPNTSGITDCFCSSLQCRAFLLIDHPYLTLKYPLETLQLLTQEPLLMLGFAVLLFSFLFVSFEIILSFNSEIKSLFKLLRRN